MNGHENHVEYGIFVSADRSAGCRACHVLSEYPHYATREAGVTVQRRGSGVKAISTARGKRLGISADDRRSTGTESFTESEHNIRVHPIVPSIDNIFIPVSAEVRPVAWLSEHTGKLRGQSCTPQAGRIMSNNCIRHTVRMQWRGYSSFVSSRMTDFAESSHCCAHAFVRIISCHVPPASAFDI